MADSTPISSEQLVDPSAFPSLYENVEKLIELITTGQREITKLMVQTKGGIIGSSPATAQQAEELKKLIARVKELETAQEKLRVTGKALTLEQAKARQVVQETNAEMRNAAKYLLATEGSVNSLRAKLAGLNVEWAKADEAQRNKLAPQLLDTTNKLKKLEEATGNHTRSVGNYTHGIIEAAKKTGGFVGIIDILGRALGVNEEVLHTLKETHSSLIMGARNLSHVTHGHTEAVGENTVAAETNTVAIEGETVALEEETVAAEEAAVATKSMTAAFMASPIGIILALVAGIAAVGIAIYEFTKEVDDSKLELDDLTESIKNYDEMLKITNGTIIKIAENKKAIDEAFGLKNGKQQLEDELNVLKAKEKARQIDLVNTEINLKDLQLVVDRAYKVGDIKEQTAAIEALNTEQKKYNKLLEAGNDYRHGVIIAEGKFQSELDKEKIKHAKVSEDYDDTLRHLKNDAIAYEYEKKKAEINEKFNDEQKKYVGHTEILLQLELNREKELQDLWLEQQRKFDKIKEEYKNNDIKKVQEDAKKESELNKDPTFSPQLKADFELAKTKKELKKKQHEEEIKEEESVAKELLKITKEYQDKIDKLKEDATNSQLDKNRSAIQVQAQLAATGRDNTLAYELKHQEELEKAKQKEIADQKKHAKEQEAIAIGLAVLQGYEKLVQTEKPIKALFDAIAGAEGAKIAGKALAGSAFEGTEDTGKNGDLDGKGGMLWMLHPNERVVKAEDNAKLNGMSNEDLVHNALMYENYNSSIAMADVSKSSQVQDSLNKILITKIETLTQVIKDKPESHTSIDNVGRIVSIKVNKGIKTITMRQTGLD